LFLRISPLASACPEIFCFQSRKIRAAELQSLINEKRAHLERLQQQLASLQKVDKEQRAIIEKLGNNEP